MLPLSFQDTLVLQVCSRDLLGDLLVVLNLALVVGQQGRGNFAECGSPTVAEESLYHHGLVEVRHPHIFLNEVLKTL
jgi:hypothetical protein